MNIIKYYILLLNFVGLYAFRKWHHSSGAKYIAEQLEENATTHEKYEYFLKWIEQPLDHFDKQEKRTWKMRYFEHLEFFKPNGPIYLYINGEMKASDNLYDLYIYEMATETNGAIYGAEHRYYGESIPLDMSIVENMKYLSSEQALADLSNLIQTIKSLPDFKHSKVAVIGGSYAGNLAAWMRVKYPDVVDAAWASSAPVLAKKDFFDYFEKVGEDYKKYGGDVCYEKIQRIFSRYAKLLQSAEGIEQLKEELNICKYCNLNKPLNKMLFFDNMLDYFGLSAQTGEPAFISWHCSNLTNGVTNFFTEYTLENIKFKKSRFKKIKSGKENCTDLEFKDNYNKDTVLKDDWSWFYQTCTEFGYYQTTDSNNQPFTKNLLLDYYTHICLSLFGPEYNEDRTDKGVARTNEQYGGRTPNVTKVVFVNGGMDPWSTLGVLKDLSDDAPARVIPDHSHCTDLMLGNSYSSKEFIKTQKFVKGLLKKWLGLN